MYYGSRITLYLFEVDSARYILDNLFLAPLDTVEMEICNLIDCLDVIYNREFRGDYPYEKLYLKTKDYLIEIKSGTKFEVRKFKIT